MAIINKSYLESIVVDIEPIVDSLAGVILFGSAATGRVNARSDIDLMVVVHSRPAPPPIGSTTNLLKSEIGKSISGELSIRVVSVDSLVKQSRLRPHFIAHLADEGKVWDTTKEGLLCSLLEDLYPSSVGDFEIELASLRDRLSMLSKSVRFSGLFATPLGQMYGLCRSVVICQLLMRGERQYDWRRTHTTLAGLEPKLHEPLLSIGSLRPFYDARIGRAAVSEIAATATEEVYLSSVSAAQRIARR